MDNKAILNTNTIMNTKTKTDMDVAVSCFLHAAKDATAWVCGSNGDVASVWWVWRWMGKTIPPAERLIVELSDLEFGSGSGATAG